MKTLDPISVHDVRLKLSLIDDTVLVLSITDTIETLLGYTAEDYLSGRISLKAQFHTDDLDIAEILFSTEDLSEDSFNIRLRQANGRIRCIKAIAFKETITDGVVLNITLKDSKSLQRTLSDSSEMINFAAIMENTDDYIYFKDRNHVFTGASQSLVSLCSPAEHWTDLLGQTDYDVFPEDLADIYYRLEKQVFSGIPVAHEVQEYRTKDEIHGWVDNRKYPIRDEKGTLIGLYGIARDITANEQLKQELIKNEEKYKNLIDNLSVGIVVHSADTSILLSNIMGSSLLGLTIEQVEGKVAIDPYWRFFQENGLPLPFEFFPVNQVINSGKSIHDYVIGVKHSEFSELVWLICNAYPVRDGDGALLQVVVTFVDITAHKELEEELIKKDKLMIVQSRQAAMGEMISMIAHQWRQPISVISMCANNILADIDLEMINNESLEEYSLDILKQTQELSKTIDDFSNFFKPTKGLDEVLIEDVFENAFNIVAASLKFNDIEVKRKIESTHKVMTYSRELMQVFLNILMNAKEAFIDSNVANKYVYIAIVEEFGGLNIKIRDNAGGIKENILDKIFEPYFSTKEAKNGTGIGLYMSKLIIEHHLGGSLTVYNQDDGACFEIQLPLFTKPN